MRAVVITEAAATIIASEWSRRHKHAPDTEIPTHVRVQMQQIAQDAVRELHNVITGHYDALHASGRLVATTAQNPTLSA